MTRKEHERLLDLEKSKTAWERDQAKQAEEARYAVERKLRQVRRALARLVYQGVTANLLCEDIPSGIMEDAHDALDETKEYA